MYLITGGAGFIGSAVVWMLNRRGIHDIIICDTLGTSPFKWKNLRGLSFREIWSPAELMEHIQDSNLPDVDTIIHLGACSSTTEADADFLLNNNYRFSLVLGEWALDHGKRFIYASSAAVYGDGSLGFSDDPELTPDLRPLNMYGYSKQLFDLHVLRHQWLDKVVGLRFFNIYGPNEYHKGPMRSMVKKAAEQVAETGEVRLFKSTEPRFADGEQVRDFFYVKDGVEAVWAIIQKPDVAGIFNVGGARTNTWNELAAAVFAAMDRPVNIQYIDMPAELIGKYQSYTCADMTSLEKALGQPVAATPLHDAIQDYVRGYLLTPEPAHLDFNTPNP